MRNYIAKIRETVTGAVSGAVFAAMAMCNQVYCDGMLQVNTITVNANVSAQTVVQRLIGLIAGLFIAVGVIKVATSAFSILEAYSEDNSAGVNKGVKQLGIGAAFIAAPALLRALLG